MGTTTNYSKEYPDPFSSTYENLWGYTLNNFITFLDSELATRTANYNIADFLLSRPVLKDYGETYTSPTISAGALTLNIENGNHFKVTLDSNVTTLTLSNPTASGKLCAVQIWLKQDGTGGRTFAWPASIKWAGGSTPTVTSTASRTDIFTLLTTDGGTTWAGVIVGQNFTGL